MGVYYDIMLGRVRDASGNGGGGGGGGGSSTTWGAISGVLSDQTDLASALAEKASLSLSVTSSVDSACTLSAADQVVEWSPVGDCTLDVASAALPSSGTQRSWEVRLNLASAATLTLGNGLVFVTDADGVPDSVTGGAINVMLVRAIASGAKVYVCGTEVAP